MDMSSTEPVTQPAPNAPKGRKPRPPKAPKDPNAPPQPKAPKPRPPKDPNAPPKEPKAPKERKPRPPKVDITHSGPIHYHETDEPTKPPFVAVYSETLEEDVPTKQRKTRSSGLDLSMANLRL